MASDLRRRAPRGRLRSGLALLVALALIGCGPKAEKAAEPPLVQTAAIGEGEFTPGIEVVSELESVTNVVLRPETDGRVVQIRVQQGERLRKGEVILVLDNTQASADYDASRAEARKDRVNAERYAWLAEQGAVSLKERDFYATQAIESRDRARSARATLGYSYLRAPFDGVIGDLSAVKVGDYVRTGQVITGIVAEGPLWTNMDVPATQAGRVRIGQTVLLTGQDGAALDTTGRVVFISPYFQSGALAGSGSPNTVLVKAEFPDPGGRLKPGLRVTNRIITARETNLAVPVQAVLMQASQPFVYRVHPLSAVAGQLRASAALPQAEKEKILALPPATPIVLQTPVQLGRLQGNLYPVVDGLSAGDRVVVTNTALLRSGMPVRVEGSPAATGR